IGVLGLAALLRFWGLGDKPLHHDESMHAYFSLQFAENPSSYTYLPLLHGPFQFHAEGLVFAVILGLQHLFASNALGNPWINDTTARFLPVCFGLGIVALPLGLRRQLGRAGALVAAFLLAVSPSFVYFSRFLREDIYFNFFMFAMVVCAVQFAQKRTMRWFVALFAAAILAYTTFEGTFITFAIFLGFLVVLAVWEFAHTVARRLPASFTAGERTFFSRAGLLMLLGAGASLLALIGLRKLSEIGAYINRYPNQSQAQATQLENTTVAVLLYASILIALIVIGTLLWQMYRDDLAAQPQPDAPEEDDEFALDGPPAVRTGIAGRLDAVFSGPARLVASLRERVDPDRQPFLSMLLGVSWVYWFVAFVVAWMLFAALFWEIPGSVVQTWGQGFQQGVGQGIWQGLYYWLEQQPIARGGQPWYYYLLLIPLYEQLAVVFGVAGIVYSLFRPTRFRLFLIWWFVVSLFLYSWAGEKMPWLSIHILLPLMLLAAVAVARALVGTMDVIRQLAASDLITREVAVVPGARFKSRASVLGVAVALLLLIPMVHSMLTLSQVDAANG
ncbi:MAG TPA: flippase activity-associated protein Agl23, partial [Ktedonobacterales bacterium]|nr:flippase activity-associated protein Agl23 [Ktedonobacterales bacterium]